MIWKLFKKTTPKVFKSKFNQTVHIGKSFGKKAIFAKGVAQSGGEYDVMWREAFKKLPKDFTPKTCLVLGVAGGTVLDVIHDHYPQAKVMGIEIDPIIIQVAKDEFGLVEDNQTKIIIADAITWVEKNKSKKFDLIIIDLYIGALNPKGSRQLIYLKRIKKMLSKEGAVFYNAHYQRNNISELDLLLWAIQTTFESTTIVFKYPKNRILLLR